MTPTTLERCSVVAPDRPPEPPESSTPPTSSPPSAPIQPDQPGSSIVVGESWDIPVEVGRPELVEPRQLHAVVSRRLDIAEHGGHRSPAKAYALGPLWERPDGRPGFALRIVGRRVDGPAVTEHVHLGSQDAYLHWPEATLLDGLTLHELDRLPPARSVLVRFASPMTRRRGNHYLPNPTPEGILGSWERAAAKVELGTKVDWRNNAARIVHLDGHTARWSGVKSGLSKQRPIGFVGEIALVAEPEHRRRLHQLARLATFAGTGSHTTFGMGFTELVAVEEEGQ